MFGQILIGFAQPFCLSAPTRYSDLWFSDRGRTSATALVTLANPFGAALGQLIDSFWATEPSQVPNMVLWISVIVGDHTAGLMRSYKIAISYINLADLVNCCNRSLHLLACRAADPAQCFLSSSYFTRVSPEGDQSDLPNPRVLPYPHSILRLRGLL